MHRTIALCIRAMTKLVNISTQSISPQVRFIESTARSGNEFSATECHKPTYCVTYLSAGMWDISAPLWSVYESRTLLIHWLCGTTTRMGKLNMRYNIWIARWNFHYIELYGVISVEKYFVVVGLHHVYITFRNVIISSHASNF